MWSDRTSGLLISGDVQSIMTSVLRGQIRSIKGQVINHFQVRDDYWRFGLVFLSKRRPWIKYLALIRPLSSPKHLQVPSFVY